MLFALLFSLQALAAEPPANNASYYISLTPCRVYDTRATPVPTPLQPLETRSLKLWDSCGVRPEATSVNINVTVIPHGPLAYLTVWQSGTVIPIASLLNSLDGSIKSNSTTVSLSTSGNCVSPPCMGGFVSFFATHRTDIIVDVVGYYRALAPSPQRYFAASAFKTPEGQAWAITLADAILTIPTTLPPKGAPCPLPNELTGRNPTTIYFSPSGLLYCNGATSKWTLIEGKQ